VSRTRAPLSVGPSPPPPIIVPAFVAACPSLSISSINAFGGNPHPSFDFTIIMNFILHLLVLCLRYSFNFLRFCRVRLHPLRHFIQLPKLAFPAAHHLQELLHVLQRLFLRVRPNNREPSHHLLRLAEWTVRNRHVS